MSVVIKPMGLVLFLILFSSCASSLEYSLANIDSGNFVKAEKYLLSYCDKFTKEDLLYPDPRSGVSFFVVLERLGSKKALEKVYHRKFSRANTPLLTGGQFSVRLINLAIKWNHREFLDLLADRLEEESGFIKSKNYHEDKNFYTLIKFASLNLSIRKAPITNLSHYWMAKNFSKNTDDALVFWDEAEEKDAASLLKVISLSLGKYVTGNQDYILNLSDAKEFELIFKASNKAEDKTPFINFKNVMKAYLANSEALENKALVDLEKIKLMHQKSSDNLSALKRERSSLQESGSYTFKVTETCTRCEGRSNISCSDCRGRGDCRHCDGGYVGCGRCGGHGRLTCHNCHGSCHIYVSERVWDHGGHCYVVRRVHVRCHHCHGFGYISCGCSNGSIACRSCSASNQCRNCSGRGHNDCPDCQRGIIVRVRKTAEGLAIDSQINGAERELNALNKRIGHLEWTVRKENKKQEVLYRY